MQLRLLAFVPPAALITSALLVTASSLVSALESTFTPDVSSAIEITRYVSRCEELDQKIETLSRAATSCDKDIQCLRSPIICPIAMDERMKREYRVLREEHHEHCGVRSSRFESPVGSIVNRSKGRESDSSRETSATQPKSWSSLEAVHVDASDCPSSSDGLETDVTSEYNEPAIFVF